MSDTPTMPELISAFAAGNPIHLEADVLGRPIAPMGNLRTRPPGIRLPYHLHKLRNRLTDQTRILVLGDSLATNQVGQFVFQSVLMQHYQSEPVYTFYPGANFDYGGYGAPSLTSASSIVGFSPAQSTASYRQKFDYSYAFDGSFIEIAPGQHAVINSQMLGDYVTLPIITEPGAGAVKIEHNTLVPATAAGPWNSPTADEIDSVHALTGSELIVSAAGARGLTTVKLKFGAILIRNLKITNTGSATVRILWQGNQVRTAPSISYYLVGQNSNAWSLTIDASLPVMAGLIRDYQPDIIWTVSDDRLADYEALLPRLESAIAQSGMAYPPAVILERNPFYQNGPLNDLSIAEATDFCWQFAQSRLDWDVLDHMAVVGGLASATKAGLNADNIHWSRQITEMSLAEWSSIRGYLPKTRETGGPADAAAVFHGRSRRPLCANNMAALGLQPGVYDMGQQIWSGITTGSGVAVTRSAAGVLPLNTGSTTSSTVVAYVNDADNPIYSAGGSPTVRQLAAIGGFKFRARLQQNAASGTLHVLMTSDRAYGAAYKGDLTGIGFGFVIRGNSVHGQCRQPGGVLFETTTQLIMNTSSWYEMWVILRKTRDDRAYADIAEWYVGGFDFVTKLGETNIEYQGPGAASLRFDLSNNQSGQPYRVSVTPPIVTTIRTPRN